MLPAGYPPPAGRVTPEEYLLFERASEGAHEYVDGVVGEERCSTRVHGLICTGVLFSLQEALRQTETDVFTGGFRIRIPGEPNYLYSDGVVVNGRAETEDEHDDSLVNPAVVVEVLWPSTVAYDLGRKWQLYRELPSLNHFIVVKSDKIQVDWYSRLDGRWLFRWADGMDAVVELDAPRCTIRLADIYDRVADLLEPGLAKAR
ncbi:MAG: Uma2 family endonuclease [Gemmatimonadetes bacterium]|nr:Uma2 family endonuclease [Gemmatimonadota bacterium]